MEADEVQGNEVARVFCRKVSRVSAYKLGEKIYPTLASAVRVEAWRMIVEKYRFHSGWFTDISDIKMLHGKQCHCGEPKIDDTPEEAVRDCPLHNRRSGYFKRLHKRLSRFLMKEYSNA